MAPATSNANKIKIKAKQPSSKIPKGPCKLERGKREAVQRTYRFDAELWAEFEVDCKVNLRNPRLVVEALVRYWLEGGPKTSEFIAWHQQKCAAGKTISKPDSIPSSATRTTAPRPNSAAAVPFNEQDFVDV
jgi:hypothetical protein